MAAPGLIEILRTLRAHAVDFIVVGGMAAVIGGAPVVTQDVDILRERSPDNAQRLLAALSDLEAVFRGDDRRLRPNASHLEGYGHLLLSTRLGALDVLGSVEDRTTFDDVVGESTWVDLGGFEVRVLSLARLLEVKRKRGRPARSPRGARRDRRRARTFALSRDGHGGLGIARTLVPPG